MSDDIRDILRADMGWESLYQFKEPSEATRNLNFHLLPGLTAKREMLQYFFVDIMYSASPNPTAFASASICRPLAVKTESLLSVSALYYTAFDHITS